MIKLQNDVVSVEILPSTGGKISSIKSVATGLEFLLQPEKDVEVPTSGMDFLPPYAYGFDECFPTITECKVKVVDKVINYPDHGELWTSSFKTKLVDSNHCILTAEGVNFPYIFQKEIFLTEKGLKIEYGVENKAEVGFEFIWSAHPLLAIELNDEILLPSDNETVEVYYSSVARWKKGDILRWPIVLDNVQLNYAQTRSTNLALKVFAKELKTKKSGFYRVAGDQTIVFSFENTMTDNLGIWICYGGWPLQMPKRDYTIALEPTSNAEDSLADAIQKKQNYSLKPGETVTWSQEIEIYKGRISF